MKKINKNGASVFVIFCLIFSSITAVTSAGEITASDEGSYGEMEILKEVYYKGDWSEGPIEVDIGETLEFRINITYHNTSGLPRLHYAYNIRVNDSLPACLNYSIGTADPETTSVGMDPNEYLYWDFGSEDLYDGESLIIKYNATVVEPTIQEDTCVNNATVIWDEMCTGGNDLTNFDILIINIGAEPELNLIKRVWNPHTLQWVKSITAYNGEILQFRIDVNNDGGINLTNVTVNDTYPEFLDPPFDGNIYPDMFDVVNRTMTWYLGNLTAHTSVKILFNTTVNSTGIKITEKNIANVTCDQGLYDEDYVNITVDVHLIVDKKVKDPITGEWVDSIPYVKRCEPVRFRINITYFGNELMKCLVVNDTLPDSCLNYSDNVYIEIAGEVITPGSPQFPEIFLEGDLVKMCCLNPMVVSENSIVFSWVNRTFGLANGDSVIIEFDATVIEYCDNPQPCKVMNCVEAWLWGCDCEVMYYGRDCVNVTCVAIPGEFNKTVSPDVDPEEWSEEIHTTEGYYIRIKLELTYYGNENLTNISFLDELCCILEYESTIQQPPGTIIDVSPDKKTIWWNVSKNVTDCEKVTIIFIAKVTGGSPCGGCLNTAYVYGYIWRFCTYYDLMVNKSDTATIFADPNTPPSNPDVSGPQEGIIGTTYTFKAMLVDADGDQLHYIFSWGDGGDTGWLGPTSPGEVTQTHSYSSAGSYSLKVKARDEHGAESGWTTYPLNILIKIAKVEISLKMLHISAIDAEITNTGEADISNLNWEFDIYRNATFDFRDIDVNGNGVISSLPIAAIETVTSDPIGFRFGKANVSVSATKTGYISPTSITAEAFLIGPIIIILP